MCFLASNHSADRCSLTTSRLLMSAHHSAEPGVNLEDDAWLMWKLQDGFPQEPPRPRVEPCACGNLYDYTLDSKTYEPICNVCGRVWDAEPEFHAMRTSAYKPDSYLVTVLNQHTGSSGETHPLLAFMVERDLADRCERIHPKTVRESLRRHKCKPRYIRSAAAIAGFLGFQLPKVDRSTVERLQALFQSIQRPYNHVKREFNRKSFLHYPTVLRKLCERIGRHDIAECMPELRTPQRRRQNEALWQRVAEKRGWASHEQSCGA